MDRASLASRLEYIDLMALSQSSTLRTTGGLAALVQAVLGAPLSKYWQMSDWTRRPLLPGQAEYAALDAWVLPPLLMAVGRLPRAVPASGGTATAVTAAAAPAAVQSADDASTSLGPGRE